MTEESLSIAVRVIRGYRGTDADVALRDGFEQLLAMGAASYVAASNAKKGDGSPFPVPYGLPFLESRLGDIGQLDSAMQERIHRVRGEHDLFNEQVSQVRTFHDRSCMR